CSGGNRGRASRSLRPFFVRDQGASALGPSGLSRLLHSPVGRTPRAAAEEQLGLGLDLSLRAGPPICRFRIPCRTLADVDSIPVCGRAVHLAQVLPFSRSPELEPGTHSPGLDATGGGAGGRSGGVPVF